MASVTSSTQTVKRLSVSPRSRFHVSRIYEDPQVPMANRKMPPITPHTPPIDLPPTPMLKSARKAVLLSEAVEAAAAAVPVSSVVIVEAVDVTDAQNSTKVEEVSRQTLSPHLTISPTSSHSSSTSPGSSSSGSSSNSNGSTSTSTDATDSVASGPEAPPRTCPLAVFGDNDITLTKESAGVVALSAAAAAAGNLNPVMESESEVVSPSEPVSNAPQTRTRKTSWIANPSAVDKLLTLFNTGTIFHRSSVKIKRVLRYQGYIKLRLAVAKYQDIMTHCDFELGSGWLCWTLRVLILNF